MLYNGKKKAKMNNYLQDKVR